MFDICGNEELSHVFTLRKKAKFKIIVFPSFNFQNLISSKITFNFLSSF